MAAARGEAIGFRADHYAIEAAEGLASELGLSYPAAAILARRGLAEPDRAREFLAAREEHDPAAFAGIEEAGALILGAIRAGRPITVYGDFDADGVCATAIMVGAIRELGGNCDWFIPDRIDGYGLNPDAIRRLAGRGTALVVTVDCGVTAAAETALAKQLGMEVVVTDHHQYEEDSLPECPVLHPVLSGYPFEGLCGAGVAAKLASWLRRTGDGRTENDENDLDLVALATVADVMPLLGENRRLVKQGVEVARRARRPGMAALLEECRITPAELGAGDFGFRLGPRINAAGRMYRADAGVELFLADSRERADEIARELSAANGERRRVEREVFALAQRELAGQGEPGPAIVVAGEGWHPGVIGIVASRLVREHGRPSVVISLDGDRGRGSGRSVPGLDLHAALGDVSGHLLGFGGHAAAAGIQIETGRIESFQQALAEAVAARIGREPVLAPPRFDAVAGGEDLGLPLATELERLGPFGNANPEVRLLLPGILVTDLREMGDGKHCRFTVVSGSNQASGVCFGRSNLGVEEGERADLLAELGLNHWRGSIEPRLIVRESFPLPAADPLDSCGPDEWWSRFEAAFGEPGDGDPSGSGEEVSERQPVLRGGLPGVRVAELISSGSRVAILTADAVSRWRAFGGGKGLGRFNPDARVGGLWEGSPERLVRPAGELDLLLTDYPTLARLPAGTIEHFEEVVLLDPPSGEQELLGVKRGRGRLHLVAGPDEHTFAVATATRRFDLTAELRELYRDLRAAGAIDEAPGLAAENLRQVLAGRPDRPRSPERAALLVRVLRQSDLLREKGPDPEWELGVVSSVQVELTSSPAFGTQIAQHKERIEFLKRSQTVI